jgi:hypothetical protein
VWSLEFVDGDANSLEAAHRSVNEALAIAVAGQVVTQWATGFGDEVLAAPILDPLPHHGFTLIPVV